ncbi:MAG: hypothetical protein KDD43_02130 [Bdellovibrionales bacterium]|nr:hypothetical protein [Bdellovibrionales bacterium]
MMKWWNRFWFAEGCAEQLGLIRIAVFFGVLWNFAYVQPEGMSGWLPPIWQPQGQFAWLGMNLWPLGLWNAVDLVWKVCLLLAGIGLFYRWTSVASALLGLVVLSLRESMGVEMYSSTLPAIFPLILAMAPGAADRFAWRWTAATRKEPWQYHWPVQLMRFVFLVSFFTAGVAKLRLAGWSWWAEDQIVAKILIQNYWKMYGSPDLSLTTVLEYKRLWALGALSVMVIQLTTPVGLIWRRFLPVTAIGLFAFQLLLIPFFGWTFYGFLPLYVIWLPPSVGGFLGAWQLRCASRAN